MARDYKNIFFWENDKILITLAIYVRFWSLRYLWKRLCEGIQDFRLSHTFTHSFSHVHTQNQNICKDLKVITISGCLTIYSVDTFKKVEFWLKHRHSMNTPMYYCKISYKLIKICLLA